MNKKLLLPALSLMILSTTSIACIAEDIECPKKEMAKKECPHKKGEFGCPHKMRHKHMMPPPADYKQHKFSAEHKAEMEAKKVEFEKRLNLTEEQKQTIEANKIKDKEKMAPIMKDIREKQKSFRAIDTNPNLTAEQKEKEKQKVKTEIKALKTQADKYRQENMKNFENVLTPQQKAEFEKIKKEAMEKKRIEHIEKMENFHKNELKKLQEAKKNPPKF